MNRAIFGKGGKTVGEPPAVILINPKYSRNVSQIVRNCSCFGIKQCWFTGNRVQAELSNVKRLPREERMKGYGSVNIIQFDYPFDQFKNAIPIGIELIEGAGNLMDFEHPENAVYVFGPEDGSLDRVSRSFCHRFLFIPMHHCANLAMATGITLYDRALKIYWNDGGTVQRPEDILHETRGWTHFENKFYGSLEENHRDKSLEEIFNE